MKKCLILSLALALVLGLGAAALAADVKVGGEIKYNVEVPTGNGYEAADGDQYMTFKLNVVADINETTSAKLELKNTGAWDNEYSDFDEIGTAEIRTKFPGFGTLCAGIKPDFGTNPFEEFGTVWGSRGGYEGTEPGISFATEKFSGLAGQVFINPWSTDYNDRQFAGEVTYELPALAGSSVGVAFNRLDGRYWYDDYRYDDNWNQSNWAFIGNIPVNDKFTVYGEFGWTDGADEMDIKSAGVKLTLPAATFWAEGSFVKDEEKYFIEANVPFQGVDLNAQYRWGDGYKYGDYPGASNGYWDANGLWTLSAKIAF